MHDIDYDGLDFEARDEIDAEQDDASERLRETLTGFPARPGTRR